jgi:hypothetical protein
MSIWDVAHKSIQEKRYFDLHIGNFLDTFYRSTLQEREAMVSQEPEDSDQLDAYMLPFLAAMTHKLCNDYRVPCPLWVLKPKYRLRDPYFPLNAKGKLRELLMEESPPEFRERNLFPSANCLSRV